MAGGVLAPAVSQQHGRLAAVPQPAHLGRVRGLDLRHGLAAVLVHRSRARPGDAARPGQAQVDAVDFRHLRARVARIRAALGALREGVPPAGRALDAAGALGPHGRELRLLDRHHPRLARDDLPALLRRGRHLRRLRDGPDARDSPARDLRAAGLHHDAAPREHGQGHARDRAHRRLRLRDGGVLRVLQREQVRRLHDPEPDDRAVRADLLVPDLLQHPRARSSCGSRASGPARSSCSRSRWSSTSACGSSGSSSS